MQSTNNKSQGKYYDDLNENVKLDLVSSSYRVNQTTQNPSNIQQTYRGNINFCPNPDSNDNKNKIQDHTEIKMSGSEISNLGNVGDNYQGLNRICPNQNFYSGHFVVPNDIIQLELPSLCQHPIYSPNNYQTHPDGNVQNFQYQSPPQNTSSNNGNSHHNIYTNPPHQSVTNSTQDNSISSVASPRMKSNGLYDSYSLRKPSESPNIQHNTNHDIQNICSTLTNMRFEPRHPPAFYQEKAQTGSHPNYLYGHTSSGVPQPGPSPMGYSFSIPHPSNHPQTYYWSHNLLPNYPVNNFHHINQHHSIPHHYGQSAMNRNQYHHAKNANTKFTVPMSVIKNNLSINPKELNEDLFKRSRYFIIKSGCAINVENAMVHGIWCSTTFGNETLDSAFCDTHNICKIQKTTKDYSREDDSKMSTNKSSIVEQQSEAPNKDPKDNKDDDASQQPTTTSEDDRTGNETGHVILFFSVNHSRSICGVAEMTGRLDKNASSGIWSESRWKGQFPINWIYIKQVSDSHLNAIILPKNENRLVTHVKDCTEILPPELGQELFKIIHNYPNPT